LDCGPICGGFSMDERTLTRAEIPGLLTQTQYSARLSAPITSIKFQPFANHINIDWFNDLPFEKMLDRAVFISRTRDRVLARKTDHKAANG